MFCDLKYDKKGDCYGKVAQHAGVQFSACKACTDQLGVTDKITDLGIEVIYWGEGLTYILKNDEKLLYSRYIKFETEVFLIMQVKKNKYNIFVEIVCLILLIGVLIYLFLNWNSIPDEIPGHYNAMGEIDRMGSKGELLILPIVGWLMYLGLSVIENFPQIWNTGVTVTEENKERVYRILKNMMSTVKLIMVAVFVYLTIYSSQAISLSVWFLPIFLILEFGSIIFFIIKLIREK